MRAGMNYGALTTGCILQRKLETTVVLTSTADLRIATKWFFLDSMGERQNDIGKAIDVRQMNLSTNKSWRVCLLFSFSFSLLSQSANKHIEIRGHNVNESSSGGIQ